MKPVVFIPEPIATCGVSLLAAECDCVTPWIQGSPIKADDSRRMLTQCDAVIVRLFNFFAENIASAPRLKVIAKHGVGVDNIDVAAATARKIPVVFTPAANANAVAEHTVTLMFAAARNLYPASEAMRTGRFQERSQYEGVELAGKTLGIIGLGRIGRRVAEIAQHGLGMRVHAYDPFLINPADAGQVILESSLESLLQSADFLTLHLPLTPSTRHLLNEERLSCCKSTCRLINTSRGGVIDEAALASAVREGRLAGAALDVFEQEPLPPDHPFFHAPNMLLTPHISSSTRESLERMAGDAARGVLDVLHGRRPSDLVNPEVWR